MLISKPSLILLLGTDGDKLADARRSDSILLLRTDPSRHRMAYLSIPRDLRVEIPGYGTNKVNAAYQLGGPALDAQDGAARSPACSRTTSCSSTSRTSRP